MLVTWQGEIKIFIILYGFWVFTISYIVSDSAFKEGLSEWLVSLISPYLKCLAPQMREHQDTGDKVSRWQVTKYASLIICITITCISINVSVLGVCSSVLGQFKMSDESDISVGDHSFSTYAKVSKNCLYVLGIIH